MDKKIADNNRTTAQKIVFSLGQIRGTTDSADVKRRLRRFEEALSSSSPVTKTDVSYLDGELLSLIDRLPDVLKAGILTQRYLDRIDELIARRRTMK